MGIFDASKKKKEREAALFKLQSDLDAVKTYAETLETRIANDCNQTSQQQGVVRIEEIRNLRDSHESLKNEKNTLLLDLRVAREHGENETRKVEGLAAEVKRKDGQIERLNQLMSSLTCEQVQGSSTAARGEKEERESRLSRHMTVIIEYESRLRDKSVESRIMQDALIEQREKERHFFTQHIQDMESHHTQQMKQAQAALEKKLLILEQQVAGAEHRTRAVEGSAEHERAAMATKHYDELRQLKSQMKAMLTRDDELERDITKRHNDQLAALAKSHTDFKEAMQQEHHCEIESIHGNLERRIKEMRQEQHCEIQDMQQKFQREIEILKMHYSEMEAQLQGELQRIMIISRKRKEELDESNSRLSESEEELRKKTEELAELTEINDQTKLRLNQTRAQLDSETRRARLTSQDKQILDQQYEFMLQQCVIFHERITTASRN